MSSLISETVTGGYFREYEYTVVSATVLITESGIVTVGETDLPDMTFCAQSGHVLS